MPAAPAAALPRIGLNAYLRSRWGIITNVEAYDTRGPEGRLHLVTVEYGASEGGGSDRVIWEREGDARVLEIRRIGGVADTRPMEPEDHEAMLAAARWNALSPFLSPFDLGERARGLAASPFFGAVQGEDYQLVPLLQALSMERISLLLADDVGLGKTIEAGLILTELILRRKVRRVLVLTPASLKSQWKEEMRFRFSLDFELLDREATARFRRNQGLDANPWRLLPRVIASYYYLRQAEVLEQFLSTCRGSLRAGAEAGRLPWDLLIVDEAHNLMPAPFGRESELARTLREIAPYFEHKLFLTATPHNGHTRSFTGLLEMLDPVRFVQKGELTAAERELASKVVLRRLKREINAQDRAAGRLQRFVDRDVEPVRVYLSPRERRLYEAFDAFRLAMRRVVRSAGPGKDRAGAFAVEILAKRLLSCPYAFADSWSRMTASLRAAEEADERAVDRARGELEAETADDEERRERENFASAAVGAWLRPWARELEAEIAALDAALAALGLSSPELGSAPEDSRVERLAKTIEAELRDGGQWREDERIVVFTEYKTSLDYLHARLGERYPDSGERIALLYGGSDEAMNQERREEVKRRFNDPADGVRILLATDTASEGLNLQATAHRLFHFDLPWNPARIEQRNGRLDRHGQARNVVVYHFACEENLDLAFLAKVVAKAEQIREDLGSLGEIFDRAFQRRLLDGEEAREVEAELERGIAARRAAAALPARAEPGAGGSDSGRGDATRYREALGFTPEAFRRLMDRALTGSGAPPPRLAAQAERGRYRLRLPVAPEWRRAVEEELADPATKALPALVFDGESCVEELHGRPLFRIPPEAALLHLGHPLVREALASWSRRRYQAWVERAGGAGPWTVRRGKVPAGAAALLRLTAEELAVNELREAFHHWTRSWDCPYYGDGRLGAPEGARIAAAPAPGAGRAAPAADIAAGLLVLAEAEEGLGAALEAIRGILDHSLRPLLAQAAAEEAAAARGSLEERIAEIDAATRKTDLRSLEAELTALGQGGEQWLFEEAARDEAERRRRLEEELELRRGRYRELRAFLTDERKRLVEELIPRRYALAGSVQVFPVGIEVILPEEGA